MSVNKTINIHKESYIMSFNLHPLPRLTIIIRSTSKTIANCTELISMLCGWIHLAHLL